MVGTFAHMMMEQRPQPASDDNLAIIISLFALSASIVGWFVVYILGVKATNIDRKNNFQLNIYQNILDRTNGLIKLISSYTVSAKSHTSAMANVLNDYRAYDNLPLSEEKIEKTFELKKAWLDSSHKVAEEGFEVQLAIEDYMRFLDMNGTDYTKGTVVYNALMEVKNDAYGAAERNRNRWNDYKGMDSLTPKSYAKMSKETEEDTDIIFDFGMCVDDVLTLIYNQSISSILNKPIKQLALSDPRIVITAKGILDNREPKEATDKK